MLGPDDFRRLKRLLRLNTPKAELAEEVRRIRLALNPHPGGQLTHNVPTLHGRPVQGIQHKYRETVLFFPSPGQTCHAYCTYCFRWAQFVGMEEFKFQASETDDLVAYFKAHPEVTDVLITGGDPMIMRTKVLRRYVEQPWGSRFWGTSTGPSWCATLSRHDAPTGFASRFSQNLMTTPYGFTTSGLRSEKIGSTSNRTKTHNHVADCWN